MWNVEDMNDEALNLLILELAPVYQHHQGLKELHDLIEKIYAELDKRGYGKQDWQD